MTISVHVDVERWPLRAPFTISRLTFIESLVATLQMRDAEGRTGVGECEPHEWDGDVALNLIESSGLTPGEWWKPGWATPDLDWKALGGRMPRSPLRNAVDCALWDLESKRSGVRANVLAGLDWKPVAVMPTIGIDTPERMADLARSFGAIDRVKVKLGGADGLDAERMEAVSSALKGTELLIDVNAGWTPEVLAKMLPVARRCNVHIVEQPLPPAFDNHMPPPSGDMVFCADESCLDRSSLAQIRPHFQFINIKLDKAGGLTEALALRGEAEQLGMGVMVGMMSGTSLAVAPASLLAQGLEVIDLELDFLVRDREPRMRIDGGRLFPPEMELWG